MKGKNIYINQKEAESIFYAIDFIEDKLNGADEEPAKAINEQLTQLYGIYKKLKNLRNENKRS
jgi:hypothetical protein